ncbi:MAG: 4-oxalocrotonate tautomerase family protein [Acetobacteraceae bacterium]|nr:4-oxalocrotonate tautomerase family protein [Acetobacteraceae bacterium]
MPRIRVEWLEGRTQEQREELARLITDAVVKVARVAPEAVTVVFQENPPHLMAKGGKMVSKHGL